MTNVYEFPVGAEDELGERVDHRADEIIALAEANARNGAPTIFLAHPNKLEPKITAIRETVLGLPPEIPVWELTQFGSWWRARDHAVMTFEPATEGLRVTVNAPVAVSGLTLWAPFDVATVTPPDAASCSGDRCVLAPLSRGATVSMTLTAA